MSTYSSFLGKLAPSWLGGTLGSGWTSAFGSYADGMVSRAKNARKVAFVALAPLDALAEIGWERQLPRGPTETDAGYRARLLNAWKIWQWSGTKYGVLQSLEPADWNASTWDPLVDTWPDGWGADGDVWVWNANDWTPPVGGETPGCSRYWVLLDGWESHGWVPPLDLGDPFLLPVGLWPGAIGFTSATPEDIETLRQHVRLVTAAHAEPVAAFIVLTQNHWEDVVAPGRQIGVGSAILGGHVTKVRIGHG